LISVSYSLWATRAIRDLFPKSQLSTEASASSVLSALLYLLCYFFQWPLLGSLQLI